MPFLDPEELKPKLKEIFENVVIPQIKRANMKQTAEEKAVELFNKMYNVDADDEDQSMQYSHSKKCALIAVDEILNNFGTLTEGKQHYAAYSTIKFYEEVKQEIENL